MRRQKFLHMDAAYKDGQKLINSEGGIVFIVFNNTSDSKCLRQEINESFLFT